MLKNEKYTVHATFYLFLRLFVVVEKLAARRPGGKEVVTGYHMNTTSHM